MEAMPLPPEQLRERVAGTKDARNFNESGAATVDEWARALASIGKKFGDFRTIVDFGCGCGRAICHLQKKIDPASQELIGLDPDAEAIEWLNSNMEHVRAYALNDLPPAPLANDSVDLVVSHSVFTHLPEDVQDEWLGDLRRILKSGGIAITTAHGEKALAGYRDSLNGCGRADLAKHILDMMDNDGFAYIQGRTSAESTLPRYYGAAFHDIKYIFDNWSRYFMIVAWFPRFALNLQDTLLLRKHDDEPRIT